MRGGRWGIEPVDASDDAIAHVGNIKIEKVAKPESAQTQIAQELTAVDGQDRFDGFDFNDDKIGYQQIDAICIFDDEAIVSKGN